jgi:hypothetical protein
MEMTLEMDSTRSAPRGWAPGLALAFGAASLLLGTLFYAQLPPVLGLPAPISAYPDALAGALSAGSGPMGRAGGFAFLGDVFIVGACLVCMRRSSEGALGWALLAVSAVGAMVLDSLMAVALHPLAAGAPGAFAAFKGWFDFLFAAGNVPAGLATAILVWEDARSARPLLPRWVNLAGMEVGLATLGSGAGFLAGAPIPPQVIGLSIAATAVLFIAFGIQLARRAQGEPQ